MHFTYDTSSLLIEFYTNIHRLFIERYLSSLHTYFERRRYTNSCTSKLKTKIPYLRYYVALSMYALYSQFWDPMSGTGAFFFLYLGQKKLIYLCILYI